MPVSSGRRDKLAQIENPVGRPVEDGDGGYSQDYELLAEVFVSVEPATNRALERFKANTTISTASDIVTMPFMAGISTQTRIRIRSRMLEVRGFADPDERGIELILACEEIAETTKPLEDGQ